jgi:hypothetical protein
MDPDESLQEDPAKTRRRIEKMYFCKKKKNRCYIEDPTESNCISNAAENKNYTTWQQNSKKNIGQQKLIQRGNKNCTSSGYNLPKIELLKSRDSGVPQIPQKYHCPW